jgi:hypothetical protein
LGEKLVIFIKFKVGDPPDLRPQDDSESLNDKYQRNDNPICHSERSEESHIFVEFLTQRILVIFIKIKL